MNTDPDVRVDLIDQITEIRNRIAGGTRALVGKNKAAGAAIMFI
jgi:hypothetical protein